MLTSLQDVAGRQATTVDKAEFSNFGVMNTTGPVAWTEVVFQLLQETDGNLKGYKDVARIKEPRYFGGIAILLLVSFRAAYLDD